MPTNRLPVLILVMSAVYLFIAPSEPYTFHVFFKVIPMLLIIIYAERLTPGKKGRTHWLILFGLLFSIIGNAAMDWVFAGLGAFIISHLFYLAGFFSKWTYSWIRASTILPLAAYAVWIGVKLTEGILADGDDTLVIPVIVYITVITLMAWIAIMTKNIWAITGGILFLLSHSILAWNMFITPIPSAVISVMAVYYAAQFFIAHSLGTLGRKNRRIVW